jgi:hypothetical protein
MSMAIFIKEIHTDPTGSTFYEHITALKWATLGDASLNLISKVDLIAWLNKSKENQALVRVGTNEAVVVVVNPVPPRLPFLRTVKDGDWSDNLLSLPRF